MRRLEFFIVEGNLNWKVARKLQIVAEDFNNLSNQWAESLNLHPSIQNLTMPIKVSISSCIQNDIVPWSLLKGRSETVAASF